MALDQLSKLRAEMSAGKMMVQCGKDLTLKIVLVQLKEEAHGSAA